MEEIRKQEPSNPDNWLHNSAPDWQRMFSKLVYLGKDTPVWVECTNEEKEQWESLNPPPEPDETI